MPASLLDGKSIAQAVRDDLRQRIEAHRAAGHAVRLDAVLCGCDADAAARVYAQSQARTCEELGIEYTLHELQPGCTEQDIHELVRSLSADPGVHAMMVHMPVPAGVDPVKVQSLIDPAKDVEGVNPANIGNIVYGRSSLAPCTALAVVHLVEITGVPLVGAKALVVGASDIVGKPVAVMLMRHEATVISCNKHTPGIEQLASEADILVAAAGVPGLVKADWVKPGAVVIDVGINRVPDPANPGKMTTVGDVDFESASPIAGWISPVPGGVGPVTVAMLLRNVVAAAEAAPSPRPSDPAKL